MKRSTRDIPSLARLLAGERTVREGKDWRALLLFAQGDLPSKRTFPELRRDDRADRRPRRDEETLAATGGS